MVTSEACECCTKFRGMSLHPGTAQGPLLRLREPLSLWGGTDAAGIVTDPHHPQQGTGLAGAVVLMRTGRGSSSSSSVLAELIRSGAAPAGFVLAHPDGILTIGALVAAELYDRRLPIVLLDPSTHARVPDTGSARVTCGEEVANLDVGAVSPSCS